MGIFDLFSKRQKRARGEVPDVYVYDNLPHKLRVQIIFIIKDAFGIDTYDRHAAKAYEFVNQTLCREFGVFQLIDNPESEQHAIFNFFLQETSVEHALDVIELCFRFIHLVIKEELQIQH